MTKFLIRILVLIGFCEAMTMKQMRNTGKIMRKSCQPKNNAEDEKIDPINDGVFFDEKEVKCYIACIMKMANTIKNGKLNYEAAIKQADLLFPEEIKEPTKEAITACRKVADAHKDICDASFHVTKCIYNHNPSVFYFPQKPKERMPDTYYFANQLTPNTQSQAKESKTTPPSSPHKPPDVKM